MIPVVAPRPEVVLQTANDEQDILQSLRRCLGTWRSLVMTIA
jgi:hypothetical protein